MNPTALRIGLISDTHGLLRPEALAALQGSDHLIHAGDIGDPAILDALQRVAPLTAVRGNNDTDAAYAAVRILVIHDVKQLRPPMLRGCRVVVSGHSHKPSSVERDGVLYVNPGSAGPRRFSLPVAVGRLLLRDGMVEAELIRLELAPGNKAKK